MRRPGDRPGAFIPSWRIFFRAAEGHDQLKVIEVAKRMAVMPSQFGLARLLARKPNILLIPGTASFANLERDYRFGIHIV